MKKYWMFERNIQGSTMSYILYYTKYDISGKIIELQELELTKLNYEKCKNNTILWLLDVQLNKDSK